MAIKVITGVPGSGKSYYAVSHIAKQNFVFDEGHFEYEPKNQDVLIITNMSGFKLPHLDFIQAAKSVGADSLYDLLRIPNLPNATEETCVKASKVWQLKEKHNAKLLFVFDEVQRQFPYKYSDDEVLFFFQYHRHLGCDIYLLAQDWKSICPKITTLTEYEYRAIAKSRQFLNELKYHVYVGFDKVGSFKLQPDKKIFSLYKSFEEEEVKGKEVRPIRKFALTFAMLAVAAFFGVNFWLSSFGQKSTSEAGKGGSVGPSPTASAPALPLRKKPVTGKELLSRPGERILNQETKNEKPEPVESPAYSIVNAGGMWRGDELAYIQLAGKLYSVKGFPYEWLPSDPRQGIVQVLVPNGRFGLE